MTRLLLFGHLNHGSDRFLLGHPQNSIEISTFHDRPLDGSVAATHLHSIAPSSGSNKPADSLTLVMRLHHGICGEYRFHGRVHSRPGWAFDILVNMVNVSPTNQRHFMTITTYHKQYGNK